MRRSQRCSRERTGAVAQALWCLALTQPFRFAIYAARVLETYPVAAAVSRQRQLQENLCSPGARGVCRFEKSPVALRLRISRLWCRENVFLSSGAIAGLLWWSGVLTSLLGLRPGLLIGFVMCCSTLVLTCRAAKPRSIWRPQAHCVDCGTPVSHHLVCECQRHESCCPRVVRRVRIGTGIVEHVGHWHRVRLTVSLCEEDLHLLWSFWRRKF